MTIDTLAETLAAADTAWREKAGYTGRPVRRPDYWRTMARHLFAAGWNHRDAYEKDRTTAAEHQAKAEEEAINTFLDLHARADAAETKIAEIKAFHAKFKRGGYMETKLREILYPTP